MSVGPELFRADGLHAVASGDWLKKRSDGPACISKMLAAVGSTERRPGQKTKTVWPSSTRRQATGCTVPLVGLGITFGAAARRFSSRTTNRMKGCLHVTLS